MPWKGTAGASAAADRLPWRPRCAPAPLDCCLLSAARPAAGRSVVRVEADMWVPSQAGAEVGARPGVVIRVRRRDPRRVRVTDVRNAAPFTGLTSTPSYGGSERVAARAEPGKSTGAQMARAGKKRLRREARQHEGVVSTVQHSGTVSHSRRSLKAFMRRPPVAADARPPARPPPANDATDVATDHVRPV